MSVSFLVSSLSMHDSHHHHHQNTAEFTSASTTTTSQDEEFNDSSLNQNNKNDSFNRKISSTITTTTKTLNHRQHYICPKCEIQIDKKQVTFEKFEQHVIKCDSSKLVCIFCLEVFDLKQEADFNNHIQRHLNYVDIRHNISNDYTNDTPSNNMNISRRDSNNSGGVGGGGGSCSTSSSSNLASSSSLSSRSNSNNEISNSAEPSNITHQQHRQNSKTCLIIQNFEPKIRKRL
jgi:hypothetical protein